MVIRKNGNQQKLKAQRDAKILRFTCNICGCVWEASYDEKCVIVNPFLKSWQSSCPEEGCSGVGLVEMWSSGKEIAEKPSNYEIDIYPLTIVMDRYSGTYSGGRYVAWNCQPDMVPLDGQEDDITAAEFWSGQEGYETVDIPAYAVGDTIEDAIRNLYQKIKNRKDGNNDA
jgi:hypothetical protein